MSTEQRRYAAGKGMLFRHIELRLSAEQRDAIYKSVLDASRIDIEYVALLTLAGLIALFGLLENSAAVIIGAVLISPLMNRPSGTEEIYKIYAESFLGESHLRQIQAEAQIIVSEALAKSASAAKG